MRSRALFQCGLLAGWSFSVPAQDATSLYRQGLRLFAEGKSEAAAASLQQSLTIQPANASAWKALGVVFATRGDYERAEPAFRNACERQPGLADACLYYGRSLYLLDRFAPAIDSLLGALKGRDTVEGHRLLALSLEALGRAAQAGP